MRGEVPTLGGGGGLNVTPVGLRRLDSAVLSSVLRVLWLLFFSLPFSVFSGWSGRPA